MTYDICQPTTLYGVKKLCKSIKKKNNPDNLTLMQIQHQVANMFGYKNWLELKEYYERNQSQT